MGKCNSKNSFSDKHNFTMTELWQNITLKKQIYSHTWRLLFALPSFLLCFYPPECSCFPVCRRKLLRDREDRGTVTEDILSRHGNIRALAWELDTSLHNAGRHMGHRVLGRCMSRTSGFSLVFSQYLESVIELD